MALKATKNPTESSESQRANSDTTAPEIMGVVDAYFMEKYRERYLMFDYLERSYIGGIGYKTGIDAFGHPLLIEHEAETPANIAGSPTSLYTKAVNSTGGVSLLKEVMRKSSLFQTGMPITRFWGSKSRRKE